MKKHHTIPTICLKGHALGLALVLPLIVCTVQTDAAVSKPARYWASIRAVDARIVKSALVWDAQTTISPKPEVDIEKGVAAFVESARSQGASADYIKRASAATRRNLEMQRNGYSVAARMDITYNGKVTNCDIMSDPVGEKNASTNPNAKSHIVDIYDGTNIIVLTGMGPAFPANGTLKRGRPAGGILPGAISRPEQLICLEGAPVTRFFKPSDTTISEGPNETIVLERHDHASPMGHITRLTLSKRTWRPLGMDIRGEYSKRPSIVYVMSDYKRYPGGIAIPSEISETRPTYNGLSVSWHLITAMFNNNADVSNLNPLVPPGTELDDYRFGRAAPQYVVHDHLPTDDEVRQEMARRGMN